MFLTVELSVANGTIFIYVTFMIIQKEQFYFILTNKQTFSIDDIYHDDLAWRSTAEQELFLVLTFFICFKYCTVLYCLVLYVQSHCIRPWTRTIPLRNFYSDFRFNFEGMRCHYGFLCSMLLLGDY